MSSPMAECSKRMRALRREIRDGSDLEGKFTLDETKEARDKLKEEGAFDEEIIKKCFKALSKGNKTKASPKK